MAEPFIAEIRIWGSTFNPRGWAGCDGQTIAINQNTALFSLIGILYGGDGTSSFNLPDLQGRSPMHFGHGPGLSMRMVGESAGTEQVTLNQAQLPQHRHTLFGYSEQGNSSSPANNHLAVDVGAGTGVIRYTAEQNQATTTTMASNSLGNTGGSQGHENRQPLLAMRFCIALTGLYPSRG